MMMVGSSWKVTSSVPRDEIPLFCGTQMSSSVFTRVCSGPHSEPDESIHTLFRKIYNIALPWMPWFLSGLFLSDFPTNILYAFLGQPMCIICFTHHPWYMWWRVHTAIFTFFLDQHPINKHFSLGSISDFPADILDCDRLSCENCDHLLGYNILVEPTASVFTLAQT
jgi:hypothetical protein